MSIKQEAKRLEHTLGGALTDRVRELLPAQKKLLVEFVMKHGYMPSLRALYVNPHEVERVMRETDHEQCEVCAEWFENDGTTMCETCTQEMS